MTLTVVILTRDESQHIARAIQSVQSVADRIVVVDSESTDDTANIARKLGAVVLVHRFVTQARQFNWALEQLPEDTDWIFRLDADEIVSPELAASMARTLPDLGVEVAGAKVYRRITFLGRPIRWGGVFPVRITRLLRHRRGRSEDRWMDEHILVDGAEVQLEGELIDDNKNHLGWWIDKHNRYASREVVEILNSEYGFLKRADHSALDGEAGVKRWLKDEIYTRVPSGWRAFLYFLYRYAIRLGFLDGKEGTAFHVLQGFWYRYLVDMKLHEVKSYSHNNSVGVETAIMDVLGIDVRSSTEIP